MFRLVPWNQPSATPNLELIGHSGVVKMPKKYLSVSIGDSSALDDLIIVVSTSSGCYSGEWEWEWEWEWADDNRGLYSRILGHRDIDR